MDQSFDGLAVFLTESPADDHAVGEDGDDVAGDVIGEGVGAAIEDGGGLGGVHKGEGSAGGEADLESVVLSGGVGEFDDVAGESFVEADLIGEALESDDLFGGHDGLESSQRGAGGIVDQDLGFVVGVGIAEADAHEKAVELGFGEEVGALELVGILGGDDEEGFEEFSGVAVDRDLILAHGLEEGGLGSRGGAVDLVGDEDVAEDGPGLEGELAFVLIPECDAKDVGGDHVGCHLEADDGAIDTAGQCRGEGGLADAWDILDEDVSAGEEADKDAVDGL